MLFLTAPLAMAQSGFDGTWKLDLSTPPIEVKADGQDQKITGHPYFDTMSIKIVDDRTIEEVDKKNGKTVATSKTSVSPDGNTLMFEFSDSSATNADPVTGKGSETRVSMGPEGSHAISGSWRMAKMQSLSENAMSITYKVTGDGLTMSTQTGQSYTAKLDGTEAPYKGDPGTTSVSVKKTGANTMEETDKRDGKVISVARITVSADGKTMKVVVDDKLRGTQSEFAATKQ